MFEKYQILIIIFFLLFVFYLVISLGAGNTGKKNISIKIKKYLFGVRILIVIIAFVSLILWGFV